MFTKRFWIDAAERCVRAFASSLAAALTAGVATPASIPWQSALTAAAIGSLVSLLMSLAASQQPNSISPAAFTPPT